MQTDLRNAILQPFKFQHKQKSNPKMQTLTRPIYPFNSTIKTQTEEAAVTEFDTDLTYINANTPLKKFSTPAMFHPQNLPYKKYQALYKSSGTFQLDQVTDDGFIHGVFTDCEQRISYECVIDDPKVIRKFFSYYELIKQGESILINSYPTTKHGKISGLKIIFFRVDSDSQPFSPVLYLQGDVTITNGVAYCCIRPTDKTIERFYFALGRGGIFTIPGKYKLTAEVQRGMYLRVLTAERFIMEAPKPRKLPSGRPYPTKKATA